MTGRSLYVMAFAIAVAVVGIATASLLMLSPHESGAPGAHVAPTVAPPAADGSVLVATTPAWTEVGGDPSSLSWSPNGRMLVFAVPRAFGTVRLMVASVDHTGRAIAEAVAPSGETSGQRFRLMLRPSWNGEKILFEGTLERSAVRRVYQTAPGDDTATPIIAEADLGGNVEDARFDDDGARFVFIHADLQSSSVELYDLRSKRSKKLDPGEGEAAAPAFAPDGKAIVYARRLGDDTDLYRVDLVRGRAEPFAQGAGHQDHATPLPRAGKAPERWLMISSADRRVGDLVILAENTPRVIERSVKVPPGPIAITADGQWVASLPANRDDLVVLSHTTDARRVLLRTGMHTITSPTLAESEGRIRLAYIAGETGNKSVYVSDVTDALAPPPALTAAAPATGRPHQE